MDKDDPDFLKMSRLLALKNVRNRAGDTKSDDNSDVHNEQLMNINFIDQDKNYDETISLNSSNDGNHNVIFKTSLGQHNKSSSKLLSRDHTGVQSLKNLE